MLRMFTDKELEMMAKAIVSVVLLSCGVAMVGLVRLFIWIGATF